MWVDREIFLVTIAFRCARIIFRVQVDDVYNGELLQSTTLLDCIKLDRSTISKTFINENNFAKFTHTTVIQTSDFAQI